MGVNPSCCGPSELRSIGQVAERRGTDDEPRKISRHKAAKLRNPNSMLPDDRKQLGLTTERDGKQRATGIGAFKEEFY